MNASKSIHHTAMELCLIERVNVQTNRMWKDFCIGTIFRV